MPLTIHIATVHWHSDFWIDLQLTALRKHLPGKLRFYAYLNGVDPKWQQEFDRFFIRDDISHAEKLNHLGEEILSIADPDDLILFIDGDAFPVANLDATLSHLQQYPLVAVQRKENQGDLQPHPCFCVTSAGLWQKVGGDWQPGGYWINSEGRRITDVGGRLLETLESSDIPWKPLLRSNRKNLHPLWFGVYGDAIYHHGAGFRDKMCRLDAFSGVDGLSRTIIRFQRAFRLGRRLPGVNAWLTRQLRSYMRWRNTISSDKVLNYILTDPDFSARLGFRG